MEHISPPVGGLAVLQCLLFLTLLIHLAYIGMVIGGSALSLIYNLLDKDNSNPKYLRFSKDLIGLMGGAGIGFFMGIVPLLAITLFFMQMLSGIQVASVSQWWITILMLFVSLFFLCVYKMTYYVRDDDYLTHISCGIIGAKLLGLTYLVFTSTKSFLIYPEAWSVVKFPVLLSFASNILPTFLYFMAMSFAVTGAAMLFKMAYSSCDHAEEKAEDREYRQFATKICLYMVLVGTFIQPVFAVLDLVVLPEIAVSRAVILSYVGHFILGMFICICAGFSLLEPEKVCGKCIAILVFLSLFAMIERDTFIRNNAMKEQLAYVSDKSAEIQTPIMTTGPIVPKVYKELCKACHNLSDKKFLGPGFKGLYGNKRIVTTNGKEREVVADENYIRKSITEPNADIVKGFTPSMAVPRPPTDEEIKQLIDYFKAVAEKK